MIATGKLSDSNQQLVEMYNDLIEVHKDILMANEEINQLALRQKEFIDKIVHELRTPTQALLGYCEILLLSVP